MLKKFLKNNFIFIILITLIIVFFKETNTFGITLSDDELYCQSDIAMDLDSGTILYGKNHTEKIYPASTTKILTAILTIENLSLDKKITVSQNAYDSIPYGSSVMGVKANEIFTVEQLLYGLMLPSGNDAALVLAEAVSGNVDNFVYLMNSKLKELNLNDTHFVNPHGFHDDNHYSTATDMANLLRYCLQNETFKKIISTLEYEIKPTNLTNESRILRSTSRICDPLYTNIYYEYILGGKTGYTIEANGTFVGYGSKDGKNIIVCAFNGSQSINGNQGRFLDTEKLAKYCFDNFNQENLIKANDYNFKIYDKNNNKYYIVGLSDDFISLKNNNEIIHFYADITSNFDTLDILSSSEETSINNSVVGKINIYNQENEIINTVNLNYLGSGEYNNNIFFFTNNKYIIFFVLIIFILLFLVIFYSNDKKR